MTNCVVHHRFYIYLLSQILLNDHVMWEFILIFCVCIDPMWDWPVWFKTFFNRNLSLSFYMYLWRHKIAQRDFKFSHPIQHSIPSRLQTIPKFPNIFKQPHKYKKIKHCKRNIWNSHPHKAKRKNRLTQSYNLNNPI